ncbi:hypothetical protein FACS189491_11340 [Spirochaetia bacterium]|nr:hypothetical protein FACS189491_11340 [Spirochaetia bacterium]
MDKQEGKPIRGIDVQYNPSTYTQKIYTKTDREGYFFLCLPEYDLYNISFREIDVSVIRGTVFSKETGKPIPGVRFHVSSAGVEINEPLNVIMEYN